jgi:hypothetical protein
MNKFTFTNAGNLVARGIASGEGGTETPLVLTIGEHDGIMRCTDGAGFSLSVPVRGVGSCVVRNIECTMANGDVFKCGGRLNRRRGTLRLDAVDQDEFGWFRFEVHPTGTFSYPWFG